MACLDCNDGSLPTYLGETGKSYYIYIGFADDDTGSNFDLVQDGRCWISFLTSDEDLAGTLVAGSFTNGWTNICCPECPDPFVETPITANDTDSISWALSGTSDHDITANVRIDADEGDNILTVIPTGLYVQDQTDVILASTIDWLILALTDFDYDLGTETFAIKDTSVIDIATANIVDIINNSPNLCSGNIAINVDTFEIQSISLEVLQDTLATSFQDLTYDDGSDLFIFTAGNDGDIWFSNGGTAQWIAGNTLGLNYTLKWEGFIQQAGIAAPADLPLLNTLGGSLSWAYIGVGEYEVTMPVPADQLKTVFYITPPGPTLGFVVVEWSGTDTLTIHTFDSAGAPADDILQGAVPFKIEIYP